MDVASPLDLQQCHAGCAAFFALSASQVTNRNAQRVDWMQITARRASTPDHAFTGDDSQVKPILPTGNNV
jgi:hypothetical protein